MTAFYAALIFAASLIAGLALGAWYARIPEVDDCLLYTSDAADE